MEQKYSYIIHKAKQFTSDKSNVFELLKLKACSILRYCWFSIVNNVTFYRRIFVLYRKSYILVQSISLLLSCKTWSMYVHIAYSASMTSLTRWQESQARHDSTLPLPFLRRYYQLKRIFANSKPVSRTIPSNIRQVQSCHIYVTNFAALNHAPLQHCRD